MSHIINYISTLPFADFENIRDHFVAKHCRVLDNDWSYIIVPAGDYSIYADESLEFRTAIEQAVGTIFRKCDNALLCFGYPKTHELSAKDEVDLGGDIIATEYLGGTLIRAYFDGYFWRLATNGAIDAYNNYWISNKSIGQLFDECLSKIYRTPTTFTTSPLAKMLTPYYTYQFILQHPELHLEVFNRPFIYHIGTFDNQRHVYVKASADHIPPPLMGKFSSYKEVVATMLEKNILGFTLCLAEDSVKQMPRYKVIHPGYKRKLSLLGRTSNMYLRYLESKAEGCDKELLATFPSLRHYSSWVEKSLSTISQSVYQVYIKKYIKKQVDVFINYYFQPILSALHQNYKRTGVRIAEDSVYGEISNYHPKRINFLLNGLEFIKTNDVAVHEQEPLHKQQQEQQYKQQHQYKPQTIVEEPSSEDIELENSLETHIARQEHELSLDYLSKISLDHYSNILRQRFLPIIIAELNLDVEETGEFYSGLDEYIFIDLLSQHLPDVAMCLEDSAFLIAKIHDFKDIIIADTF
jgi:hypothetical protein